MLVTCKGNSEFLPLDLFNLQEEIDFDYTTGWSDLIKSKNISGSKRNYQFPTL